jgi:hypothetical protein
MLVDRGIGARFPAKEMFFPPLVCRPFLGPILPLVQWVLVKRLGLNLTTQLIQGGNYECLQLYEYFHCTSSWHDDKLSTITVDIYNLLAVWFRRLWKITKSGY